MEGEFCERKPGLPGRAEVLWARRQGGACGLEKLCCVLPCGPPCGRALSHGGPVTALPHGGPQGRAVVLWPPLVGPCSLGLLTPAGKAPLPLEAVPGPPQEVQAVQTGVLTVC